MADEGPGEAAGDSCVGALARDRYVFSCEQPLSAIMRLSCVGGCSTEDQGSRIETANLFAGAVETLFALPGSCILTRSSVSLGT